MNENIENSSSDDSLFDRLVDGRLSEERRRELLESLDIEPGGWRRCALAFLEAQCWKEALNRSESEESPFAQPNDAAKPARSPWPGRIATTMAMAASFLLAMWIGWWAQSGKVFDAGGLRLGQFAHTADSPTPANQDPQASPTKPWEVVTVSVPGSDGRPCASFNLPAIERRAIDSRWLEDTPSAIPQDVREALARTGHEIKQHRELVPVSLQDGRQLVMPVDQVDVRYVGNGPF
ncbi:MAG: hypothetical protein GX594_09325 [Pirellulaceae bacterium]|nr:hypothetical protein [Pirellulaceae bacterium]